MYVAENDRIILQKNFIEWLENPLGFLACHSKKAAVCLVAVNLSENLRGWIVEKVISSGKLEMVAVSWSSKL